MKYYVILRHSRLSDNSYLTIPFCIVSDKEIAEHFCSNQNSYRDYFTYDERDTDE